MVDASKPLGSRENPIKGQHKRFPPRECNDPLHDPAVGLWFYPVFPGNKRCILCCRARPNPQTAYGKAYKKKKAREAREGRKATPDAERQAIRFLAPFIKQFKSEASKLSDEPTLRSFGTYGKIKCTDREVRLAQLDIAKDEPGAELYIPALSILTGITVSDILAMQQGEGSQPRYPEMRAFYQIQNASKTLYARLRNQRATIDNITQGIFVCPLAEWLASKPEVNKAEVLEFLQKNHCHNAPSVDVTVLMRREGQLMDMEERLFKMQPKPEKKAEIDFGERERMPPEEQAAGMASSMLLTEPPSEERNGGPGPLR